MSLATLDDQLVQRHDALKQSVTSTCCGCYTVHVRSQHGKDYTTLTHSRLPCFPIFCMCDTSTTIMEDTPCHWTIRSIQEGCLYGDDMNTMSCGLVDYKSNHKCAACCCPCYTILFNVLYVASGTWCFRYCDCCWESYKVTGQCYAVDRRPFIEMTDQIVGVGPSRQQM